MRALMLRFMRLGWPEHAMAMLPGLTICAVIALAAGFAAARTGTPPMLCALLLGTALHYLSEEMRTAPGVAWCVRFALRLGIGLLGARVTAAQIVALGWSSAFIILAAVTATLLCGLALARRLGLSSSIGVLAGGATAGPLPPSSSFFALPCWLASWLRSPGACACAPQPALRPRRRARLCCRAFWHCSWRWPCCSPC